jgi:hypothetical protein
MVGITCTVPEHNDTKPVYPLGHEGLNAIPATCTTEGNTGTGICIRTGCGQTLTGTVTPALGHDHSIIAGSGSLVCRRIGCNHQYAIGDTGPAGGIIFYVADGQEGRQTSITVGGLAGSFNTYTAYYLEAYPSDIDGTRRWVESPNHNDLIPGLSQNVTDQTDWVIGRGRMNTAIIIARGISEGYETQAATACAALGDGWFLPSRNELNELYKLYAANGKNNYGNLTTDWYWSSSQASHSLPHRQNFSDGTQNSSNSKPAQLNVRAVRAF